MTTLVERIDQSLKQLQDNGWIKPTPAPTYNTKFHVVSFVLAKCLCEDFEEGNRVTAFIMSLNGEKETLYFQTHGQDEGEQHDGIDYPFYGYKEDPSWNNLFEALMSR